MADLTRYWLAFLLVLGTSGLGWAQGTILFSNFDPDHGVDGRVLTWDGSLAGPDYVAQLLVSDLRLRHTYCSVRGITYILLDSSLLWR